MPGLILSEYIVKVINIFLIGIYSLSLLYVIVIMTTMAKVFDDRNNKKVDALIPFYNIYVLLKIVGIKSYFIILLFIPIANIVLFIMINSRLVRMYRKDAIYALGMFFVPSVFFRLLLKKGKKQKEEEKKHREAVEEDLTFEMDSLLTQEDYNKLNEQQTEETKVDNVFKAEVDLIEEAPAYKAKKVKQIEEEKDEFVDL